MEERKRKAALALKNDPQRSVQEICDILGISRNTYYKYMRLDEKPASETISGPKR